ncbi:glucose PTS transporter subunit IIA [Pediococcus acidilactici]
MKKAENKLKIVAPVKGKVIPLNQVPDSVFAQKMMGEGFGMDPVDKQIVAPVKGTITMVAETKHAIGIKTKNGVEVLVHLGIDTVELKGTPYHLNVRVGDEVEAGSEMGTWELDDVRNEGKQTTMIVVITNSNEVLEKIEIVNKTIDAGAVVATVLLKATGGEQRVSKTKNDRFVKTAETVITAVGGPDNIKSVIHCISRVRFYLKDINQPDDDQIRRDENVIDIMRAQGQYQVVIGPDVVEVYDAVIDQLGEEYGGEDRPDTTASKPVGPDNRNLLEKLKDGFDELIGVITGSMSPIIWSLAAAGILKGLLSVLTMPQLGEILTSKSTAYIILNAIGDSVFFFLPIMVGFAAAKRIGGDPIIAAVIGGVLVHPTLTPLAGKSLGILGSFNFQMVQYPYSIFPMILATWLAFKIENWLKKHLPNYLTMIFVPFITILVVSAITIYITGPVIIGMSDGLAKLVSWALVRSGWVSGILIGSFHQVLVIFGLHWGIQPLVINDIATAGHSYLNAIICQTMISQGAATLAVAIKSKKANLKSLSFAAAISAFCGVTEPAIYGVNLRYRRVFISGLTGSAFGGFITGLLHGNMFGFAGSWIGFASFFNPTNPGDLSSFYIFLISSVVSTIVGFVLTYVWGYSDKMEIGQKVDKPVNPGKK